MSQISLYMDETVMSAVRAEAALQGISLSRFIASLVKDYAKTRSDSWPVGYWEEVYGCIGDAEADKMHAAISQNGLDSSLDDACDWLEEV